MQKKFFKLLPPVICKNLMKLSFCKELVGEAMSILQQPGMELFENFFLHVVRHVNKSNLSAISCCFNSFCIIRNYKLIFLIFHLKIQKSWNFKISLDFVKFKIFRNFQFVAN